MSSRVTYCVVSLLTLVGSAAFAQQPPQGGGPGGPGGRPDFAQMQKDFLNRIKESLEATDDEWKALEPRIQLVQQLQRDASARMMMFGPQRGGPGGGPGGPPDGSNGPRPGAPGGAPNDAAGPGAAANPAGGLRPDTRQPRSAVQEAAAALQEALSNKDASPDEIKATLAALRDARTKAQAALAQAQEDLRGLLTTRQEAVLVTMGMLE